MKTKILILLLFAVLLITTLTSCGQRSQNRIDRLATNAADFYGENEELFDLMMLAWSRFTQLRAADSEGMDSTSRASVELYIFDGELMVSAGRGISTIQSREDLLSLDEWGIIETILMDNLSDGGIDVHISDEMIQVSSHAGTFGSPMSAFKSWVAVLPWSPQEPILVEINENWGVIF